MTERKTPWTPGPYRLDWERGFIESPDNTTVAFLSRGMRSNEEGNKATGELLAASDELAKALTDAAATLTEAANCLRPTFPSLADNVIEKCAVRCRALLARIGAP